MGLVRLDLRGCGRVVLVAVARVTAARALPLVRDLRVSGEGRPALVTVRAPEGHPTTRRDLAAFGLAHRPGTYSAAPDPVATGHGTPPRSDGCRQMPCLSTSPSAMIAANHTMPVKMVIRSRFFSTIDEPDRVDETPPPNRSDRPPPLPRCSRMSSTRSRLVISSTIEINSDMGSLGSGCSAPSSVPDVRG